MFEKRNQNCLAWKLKIFWQNGYKRKYWHHLIKTKTKLRPNKLLALSPYKWEENLSTSFIPRLSLELHFPFLCRKLFLSYRSWILWHHRNNLGILLSVLSILIDLSLILGLISKLKQDATIWRSWFETFLLTLPSGMLSTPLLDRTNESKCVGFPWHLSLWMLKMANADYCVLIPVWAFIRPPLTVLTRGSAFILLRQLKGQKVNFLKSHITGKWATGISTWIA